LGGEGGKKSRARGLEKRVDELISENEEARTCVDDIMEAARSLPGQGWRQRLRDEKPRGVTENFLSLIRAQVYARAQDKDAPYSIETDVHPLNDGVFEAANTLAVRLNDLKRPMEKLIKLLRGRLEDQEEFELMSTEDRQRIESITNSIKRRTTHMIDGWIKMLDCLKQKTPPEYVDWFGIDRIEGRDYDVGMFRHWVDPAVPFAATLKPHAHGIVMTSASLRDQTGGDELDWITAENRTGLSHMTGMDATIKRVKKSSPFDYQKNTRILVVRDVPKTDMKQVSAAYKALNLAAGGGALNLFTAIQRQKAVYEHIAADLETAGYPIYAQHLDGLHVSTLIDMFRDEEDAILFGTDATRDGMDVPGNSLRLIVFDRVPWPRPDILHKARRAHFGRAYDELLTRARLKQAYGRLIRSQSDRGIFVMLDPMLPTRMCSAFPEGVEIERIGLSEALEIVKTFY
jgi:ATP-dependent DNA helicase DinG